MGSSPHNIPLSDAIAMTTRARDAKLLPINAWRFERDIFDAILAQQDVEGIRIYLGLDKSNQPNLILVGTDTNDQDLAGGEIGELAWPCPPYCDPGSPLHTGT